MAAQLLPTEVLKRIIAFTVDAYEECRQRDGIGSVKNSHALQYGLVARGWLEPSREIALHDLHMVEPSVELYDMAEYEEDPFWIAGPYPDKLASLCVHHPERLRHLRRLDIHLPIKDLRLASIYDSFLTIVGLFATGLIDLKTFNAHNLSPIAANALGTRSIKSFETSWDWKGDGEDRRGAFINRARPDGGLLGALLDGPTRISLKKLHIPESLHDGKLVMLSALDGRELPSLTYWKIKGYEDLDHGDLDDWTITTAASFTLRAPLLDAFVTSDEVLGYMGNSVEFFAHLRVLCINGAAHDLDRFPSLCKAYLDVNRELTSALYGLPATTTFLRLRILEAKIHEAEALENVRTWLVNDYDRSRRRLERLRISDRFTADAPQWLQDFCTQRRIELVWRYS